MGKKLLAVLLCIVMVMVLLPTVAFAATEFDISTGDLTINDGDGDFIITETTTEHTVTVTGGTHNITLKDANIDASSLVDDVTGMLKSAFDINSGATVNLTLEGTNALTAGNDELTTASAALRVPGGATVTIDGTGSLSATSNGFDFVAAAAIGGNYGEDFGTITINGDNVIATGGSNSAGIGGGAGNLCPGDVVITGGNIKATGGTNADAVGGDKSTGGNTESIKVTNGSADVYLAIITLDGVTGSTPISGSGTGTYIYGVEDVMTLDTNKLYFYLADGTEVNGVTVPGTENPGNLLFLNEDTTSSPIKAHPIDGYHGNVPASGTLKLATAEILDVTVAGTKGKELTAQDATIVLTTEKFNALAAGTDVSAWFTNMPKKFGAKIKTNVTKGDQTATVTFSGTPTADGTTVMAVVIPKAVLASGSTDMTVIKNPNSIWKVGAADPPPATKPTTKPTTTPTTTVTSTTTVEAPKTGDDFQPVLWFMMALLAGAGLTASVVIRRKRQNG